MIEYAKAIEANDEVLNWCETTLKAYEKKHGLDESEAEHILDYLASDAAPKRLRKMSYKQAKQSAEKWTKALQKKGRGLVDSDDDIETIHDFGDGTKIVKLLTKKAYEREGTFMAHCVGSYNPESTTIYSYRDKNNEPHATFEVSRNGGEIFQIKGKGNGPIHPRYINPILVFLKSINLNARTADMKNLGYYHLKDEARKILSMFVDVQGKSVEIISLFGENYIYARQ